jgi:hypothetical protein
MNDHVHLDDGNCHVLRKQRYTVGRQRANPGLCTRMLIGTLHVMARSY